MTLAYLEVDDSLLVAVRAGSGRRMVEYEEVKVFLDGLHGDVQSGVDSPHSCAFKIERLGAPYQRDEQG